MTTSSTPSTPYAPRGLVGVDVPVHNPITLEVILNPKFEDRQQWNQHLRRIKEIEQESSVPARVSADDNPSLPRAAADLDQDEVTDWLTEQIDNGTMQLEDITKEMARFALTDASTMRLELAKRMERI